MSFNPRPPVGGDRAAQPTRHTVTAFQSTPPRGRRPRRGIMRPSRHEFQSTPPRGRRPSQGYRISIDTRFQSTPPRGRRRTRPSVDLGAPDVSIHAPPWEATQVAKVPDGTSLRFQSTPPRGRRRPHPKRFPKNRKPRRQREPSSELALDLAGASPSSGNRLVEHQKARVRTSPAGAERFRFAPGPQITSGPSRSRLGLAPTCSTRRRQLAPR